MPPELQVEKEISHNLLNQKIWPFLSGIRALVVMDGRAWGGHFASFGAGDQSTDPNSGDDYFGLSEFIKTLTSHGPSLVQILVTKAHRDTDVRGAADIENFRFNEHDLSVYDEIFLFGVAGPGETNAPMTDVELEALSTFMDGGGGIFATGDHEDLGVVLNGRVPRVRSMRKWYYPSQGPHGEPIAPPALGVNRIETTQPGHNETFVHFDNQSDDIPQPIRPRWYAESRSPFFIWLYPHPLLCSTQGAITVLPDHMHEGEVIVPADTTASLTFNGKTFTEYPTDASGNRVVPEIVAWGTVLAERDYSTEPAHVGDPGDVANARQFGVIGAYDGHRAGVGRVAVDSTWHHFFDINLIGDPIAPFPKTEGFTASAEGLNTLSKIKAYYKNIATWIARPGAQLSIFASSVWYCLRSQPLNMIISNRREYNYHDMLNIGNLAIDKLFRIAPPCSILVGLWRYFVEGPVKVIPPDPWAKSKEVPVVDPMLLLKVSLGSAIIELSKQLPALEKHDAKEAGQLVIKTVQHGVNKGMQQLGGDMVEHAISLMKLANDLKGAAHME
jgi:hypothetical protein